MAERLNSRGLGVETNCKICNGRVETVNHVLFHCSSALHIWGTANITLPPHVSQQSLEENFTMVFSLMDDSRNPQLVYRAIPWVMWMIWKYRNSLLYAETHESIVRLMQTMVDEVDQWFTLNVTQTQANAYRTRGGQEDKWCPPAGGVIKCNVHANWMNAYLHCGAAWISRDQGGIVRHHARDAFVNMPNRLVAELKCVIWALRSLRDLNITRVIIASDYYDVLDAIKTPLQWPRYRVWLEQIRSLKEDFESLKFECAKATSNGIARDIAKSVLRDGRYQSYLALGGPSWLHDRIWRETVGSDV